ncbi:MAG: TIGR00268 family protein, partial [Spirochaetota bacterium]|nr:TIGR00268 family protein [Spirochaetota bacterium]
MNLEEKYLILKKIINDFGSVVIGFSGGVDSTLLAKVAFEQLGNRSLAVIGVSPSYPNREKEESIKIA